MTVSQTGDVMNPKTHLLCAWSGVIVSLSWMIGWFLIAGLFPPHSPAASGEEIKALLLKNPNMLFAGMCITMIGVPLIGSFSSSISQQLKRIEGRYSVLADTQLGLGMLMIVMFIFPAFSLGVAAFRPERDAATVLVLSDSAWLPFISGFQCTFWQWLIIGICILQDKEEKIFPHWLGYFNIIVALGLLPCAFTFFTKTGPFAWDGWMALWFVVVDFEAWFLVNFYMVRKNILKDMKKAG